MILSFKIFKDAKSLQSCPTLCDPTDGSPPGSPVPGILQARTLEWVAISFSNAGKWKWKWSRSVVPDPQRLHGLQPSRLLRPWDFPGKNTGVGCHCLLRKYLVYLVNIFLCIVFLKIYRFPLYIKSWIGISNFHVWWEVGIQLKKISIHRITRCSSTIYCIVSLLTLIFQVLCHCHQSNLMCVDCCWPFCFVPLVYLVWHFISSYLSCCSFITSSDVDSKSPFPYFLILLWEYFAIFNPLLFNIHFRINLSVTINNVSILIGWFYSCRLL